MIWQRPGFAAVVALTLALGIGANTAVFSVVYAVLLRPLAYTDPDRIVTIRAENTRTPEEHFGGVAPADFLDWRAQSQSFAGIAAYTGGGVTLVGADQPEALTGVRVSEDFLTMLGTRPLLGRAFAPEEFAGSGQRVLILSHRLWQARFGGDPNLIGRELPTSDGNWTVIGVMPPDFRMPATADVWRPLPREAGELALRGNRYFNVIARLKPDVTVAQAQAELSAIAAGLEQQYPRSNEGWGVRLVPLRESMFGKVRPALLTLFGAVGFVLLIACANVANLLLARATARGRELAIRSALGATRWRILRQLLTESLLLAFVGGALGVLLALWSVDALVALVPADLSIPRLDEARVDILVLGFTLGVSLLTGLLLGLLPGLRASRPDLQESLKEGGGSAATSLRLRRIRSLLVIAEVAVTLVLLVGAGLLIRSLSELQNVELGFDSQNLLAVPVGAPMQRVPREEQRVAYYREMQERLAQLPGVRSVATNASLPLSFSLAFPFRVEGRVTSEEAKPQAMYSAISPDYFRTMGIPLLAGRDFSERDAAGAPDVAIINETMTRRVFGGSDPLGQRLTIDYLGRPVTLEVVGVAGTVRQSMDEEPDIEIYAAALQRPWFSSFFIIRSETDPASLLPAAQRAIRSVDPAQSASGAKTMEQIMAEAVAQPRFYTLLLGLFAGVALLLAAIGIYGVMSYTVAQRTQEIGVRLALGAQSRDVLKLVIGQGMALALLGVAFGLIIAFAVTRVMSSLLYGVGATDPVTFAGVALLLTGVAFVACYIPARRATRVDPLVALRYE